jgi:predicted DNA binding protein
MISNKVWVAKVKLVHQNCITSQLTKKHNVTNLVYGLGCYQEKGNLFFNILHVPRGTEANVKAFIKEVKKDPRIIKFEQSGGMFFTLVKEPEINKHLVHFYNPKIFYLKPDLNTPTGHEVYEVASWDKKPLMDFVNMTKKHMRGELLKFKDEKVTDLFFPHVTTKLTEKQLQAISLANSYGYYNYPRRINQEDLARIMRVSKSTFQSHLRTAEKKIMPFLIGQAQILNQ